MTIPKKKNDFGFVLFQSPTIRGSDLIRQKLEHGKPWEGTLNCKRRTGDLIPLESRALPVSFSLSSKR
jgi:hypothetical protein